MSYLLFIPSLLRALEQRPLFIAWLRAMPVSFNQRLRIYFEWLDLHDLPYTPDEIALLYDKEHIVDPDSAN